MDFFDKFDRQKLQRITLIVIAALTLLALVLLLVIIITSVGNGEGGLGPGVDLGDLFDSDKIDFTDATVSAEQLAHGSLLLANASHPYTAPSNSNFVNIAQYRNEHTPGIPYSVGDINNFKLETEAMEYAHSMLTALRDQTGNDCIMISGAYGKDDSSKDLHTGYTMVLTVIGAAEPYLENESNKVLNDWLLTHAHEYGFVVRYPADKADKTVISDYTYAFRYVGVPHAHYMKENNLCLEEYIELLKNDHASQKKMLEIKVGDKEYGVYYQPCVAGDAINVPENIPNPDGSSTYPFTLSGTNDGGVAVTVQVN